ncbi:hypothetical protein AOC36_08390 [Erysipelothrix larvae]|uniref:Glycosyl transferase family 1 domain-containing protein n=1 Tax=Erysipelothrix larvae TaxID=1514105 RepID=A0A109UHB2_9FIRM|nr:glycosyltransferase [Erysipelothrix larvae]AMC94003.1 hypothetical protein AOC36_08390 [Erysipelothrix larvae]
MRKKILFIIDSLFTLGGEQRVLSVYANEFVSLGYDVSIFCRDIETKEDRSIFGLKNTINIYYPKEYNKIERVNRFLLKKFRGLNRKTKIFSWSSRICEYLLSDKTCKVAVESNIKTGKYDTVIALGSEMIFTLAMIAPKLNCTTIGWQHSSFEGYFNEKNMRMINEHRMVKKLLPNLDNYVVLTDYDKRRMKEVFDYDCIRIYNAKSFESDKQSNLTSKKFLAAGRLDPVKGFDMMLEAFSIFCNENNGWSLSILGEGNIKDQIKERIKFYNLGDKVFLHGRINNIQDYLLDSSCFLLSSKLEGFGLVVVESLEMGVPVISFDTTGPHEILNGYDCGNLIEKYDVNLFAAAMNKISRDYKERVQMGINAKKRADDFNLKQIIEMWTNII